MPFTANRRFKRNPRFLAGAEGMYYLLPDGRRVLDGIAGLWCVNAGHCRAPIVRAIQEQAARLDYASSFDLGHPGAFELAKRLARLAPHDLDHVFFTSSGSEAVDTALKIALAYHRARGEGTRQRLVGRERSYHGVGFGGISVAGIGNHRKQFGVLLPGVAHLPHTHDPARNAFSRGQPEWGAHLADHLERIVALNDASTIAAVIVEPVAGSGGILVPPKGYLERLRELCDRYGILLIFDEVITGFGRLGAAFAAERFGVLPDMITCAKALTNGAVPMGAVLVRRGIYDAFMNGPEQVVELFHGYTYSAHPLACAAALAALDVYAGERLFERARDLEPVWEAAAHALRGSPHVVDIRTIGLLAAIELEPVAGAPGRRAYECARRCFERGVLVRPLGESLAISPPLVIERAEITRIFETIAEALRQIP
ncbi:MAG TPA: aspartate aminotransferase family protein [Thermodesulfobacteriota bacterium]